MNADPFLIFSGIMILALIGPYIIFLIFDRYEKRNEEPLNYQFAESLAKNHFTHRRFEPGLLKNAKNRKLYKKTWDDFDKYNTQQNIERANERLQ